MKEIDAFGLQCPQPLMMAKKELDAGADELQITVSTEAAVNNLRHLGVRLNRTVDVADIDGGWAVTFGAGSEATDAAGATDGSTDSGPETTDTGTGIAASTTATYAVFVGKDHVGEGAEELGQSLMKMALYTLSESGEPPAHLLFMNSGVKLVAGGEQQVIDSVSSLIAQGTEVLVCGTCLDYYGLKDELQVGEVSNMYDILSSMQTAGKVITL